MFEYKDTKNDSLRNFVWIGLSIAALPIMFFIALFMGASSLMPEGGGEYNVINTQNSSDSKYSATVYAGWGGGAAGWTFIRVAVNPIDEPFNIELEKDKNSEGNWKYVVFDTGGASDVRVNWKGENNLLITYKAPNNTSGFRVYKSLLTRNKKVKISFVEEVESAEE